MHIRFRDHPGYNICLKRVYTQRPNMVNQYGNMVNPKISILGQHFLVGAYNSFLLDVYWDIVLSIVNGNITMLDQKVNVHCPWHFQYHCSCLMYTIPIYKFAKDFYIFSLFKNILYQKKLTVAFKVALIWHEVKKRNWKRTTLKWTSYCYMYMVDEKTASFVLAHFLCFFFFNFTGSMLALHRDKNQIFLFSKDFDCLGKQSNKASKKNVATFCYH